MRAPAAASGSCDAIIAAGGDGTIRHVAAALLDQPLPLGIIPIGTANVLAQEVGLAATPGAVVPMLLEGPIIRVACARANDEPFLLMAGAGFDARVVATLNQRLKSRLGKAAYAGPLVGALIRDMDTLAVTIDGRRHEASWAVITNARHYGGRFVLAPRTGIQERGLEAILFKAKSRAELLAQLMSLALGRLHARAAAGRQCGDAALLARFHHRASSRADPDRWRCGRHHAARGGGRRRGAATDRACADGRHRQPGALTFR